MSLPLGARSAAGKKAGVESESASGTQLENWVAGPQGALPFSEGVEAGEVARPYGPFHGLPAGVVLPYQAGPHLSDETAEDLVRNALSGLALAGVEEHLLLCQHCQRRVEALDRFVADLRPATIRLSLWTWLRPGQRAVLCR